MTLSLFLYMLWEGSLVSFFACVCPIFQTPLMEEIVLPSCIFLPHLSNTHLWYRCGFVLGSLFCSIDLCVCFWASARLFWLLWPCSILWYYVVWCKISFWNLLNLFKVFRSSVYIFGLFVLVQWNVPMVFWQELCWIYRLL